jgi:uncharacterized protein YkwD
MCLFSFLTVPTISFSQEEIHHEIIQLVNFVRQEPQRFLEEIALPYIEENALENNSYAKSLIRALPSQLVLPVLNKNENLTKMAVDYALEAGKRGWTDHIRTEARFKKYAPKINITGENLQFGSMSALEVVMDLLIDQDVRNLGHRKNILDIDFTEIGVAFDKHKTYEKIGVMVFGGFDKE